MLLKTITTGVFFWALYDVFARMEFTQLDKLILIIVCVVLVGVFEPKPSAKPTGKNKEF